MFVQIIGVSFEHQAVRRCNMKTEQQLLVLPIKMSCNVVLGTNITSTKKPQSFKEKALSRFPSRPLSFRNLQKRKTE